MKPAGIAKLSQDEQEKTLARSNGAQEKSRNRTSKKEKGKYLHFFDVPFEVRDQLEKLKSSIILRNSSKNTKTTLFLSYNHGEGTSTVAVNFAESLAQDGKHKILLVDGNTRNPCLHRFFDLDNTVGFSDLLIKKIEISEIVRISTTPNLFLIPSGKITYHLSQVLDNSQFKNFLDKVKEQYDFIIFDASPIGKYYDSLVLASQVNGVILVVEAEKTPWYEIKRAKQMLENKSIPILGAVLNRRKYHIPAFVFERFFR
jgi:capsular exopolysaccharide synthesis family protein